MLDSEIEKEQERAEEQWERLEPWKRDQVEARLAHIIEVSEKLAAPSARPGAEIETVSLDDDVPF